MPFHHPWQLVEVLQGPLQKAGGMLPLPEVYCLYCRVRGSELISPDDLLHALECLPHVQAPMQVWQHGAGGFRVFLGMGSRRRAPSRAWSPGA